MKRGIFYLILVLALAGVSWFGWQWQQPAPLAQLSPDSSSKSAATGKPGGKRAKGPVTVNAVAAVATRIEDQVTAVGALLAAQSVRLAPEIDGRVVEIGVSDGQSVSTGDLLFRLDDAVTEAELAQSQAELSLARADLKRARNLAKQSFVSKRSREEAAANVKILAAKLQVVSARLSKTRIRAPFEGQVGLVQVNIGEYLKAGTSLVRLDDLSSLKLDLRVPDRLLSRVATGQTIRASFDAYPGREFEALVETIDTAIDEIGRSLVVRGRLPNAERLLRPGMFARARLVLGVRESAVMVPEESVLASAKGQYLFAIRDGKAQRQPVKTGVRQRGQIEIVEGVEAGEMVVTAGQVKLRGNNIAVRVIAPATGVGGRQDAAGPKLAPLAVKG